MKTTKITIKQFTQYVWSFYGPKQIYGDMFSHTLTHKELNAAVSILVETREFEGDSVDREAVRDIMLANRRPLSMKDKQDLKNDALRIAKVVEKEINGKVPESVSDMPYARQYVLEEVVSILSGAI